MLQVTDVLSLGIGKKMGKVETHNNIITGRAEEEAVSTAVETKRDQSPLGSGTWVTSINTVAHTNTANTNITIINTTTTNITNMPNNINMRPTNTNTSTHPTNIKIKIMVTHKRTRLNPTNTQQIQQANNMHPTSTHPIKIKIMVTHKCTRPNHINICTSINPTTISTNMHNTNINIKVMVMHKSTHLNLINICHNKETQLQVRTMHMQAPCPTHMHQLERSHYHPNSHSGTNHQCLLLAHNHRVHSGNIRHSRTFNSHSHIGNNSSIGNPDHHLGWCHTEGANSALVMNGANENPGSRYSTMEIGCEQVACTAKRVSTDHHRYHTSDESTADMCIYNPRQLVGSNPQCNIPRGLVHQHKPNHCGIH
eukprot:TRINITY_DN61590_c0_g1_i1.p2 TRINITY_DN61590_c0_g1~~TRINITY_DN61590_c0_g1_i1.p2  ORF type:complete len:367 (-),score=76.95 TRINITY_DN61590_c0_g1_i1:696-1796(-)